MSGGPRHSQQTHTRIQEAHVSRICRGIRIIIGLGAIATAHAPWVYAQSNGQSNDAQSSDALVEIVVTATRHSDPVNRVPLSISAQTQEQLGSAGRPDHRRSSGDGAWSATCPDRRPPATRPWPSAASVSKAAPPPRPVSTWMRPRWPSAPPADSVRKTARRCRRCSIWSGSRCCAGRRAPCLAAARRAAPSVTSSPRRA